MANWVLTMQPTAYSKLMQCTLVITFLTTWSTAPLMVQSHSSDNGKHNPKEKT